MAAYDYNFYKPVTDSTQNSTTRKDIICDCTGTTYQKIQQLIDDGASSLDEIANATGATTGCASCDILVLELLEDSQSS